eukprot:363692-Chlamydomonas_euryale.AAC.2
MDKIGIGRLRQQRAAAEQQARQRRSDRDRDRGRVGRGYDKDWQLHSGKGHVRHSKPGSCTGMGPEVCTAVGRRHRVAQSALQWHSQRSKTPQQRTLRQRKRIHRVDKEPG